MPEIVPTILTSDFNEFSRKIKLAKGIVERVQIDVIDGKFAPKKTVTLEGIRDLVDAGPPALVPSGTGPVGGLRLDLHLMVDKPEDWVNRSLELLPDRIIGQVEMMSDPKEFVSRVVEGGVEAGIALDLETPVESVAEEIYHLADLILILGVKAGMGGQEFAGRALKKIEQVKKIVGDLVKIGVDGGLNEKNIISCRKMGAEIFYIGNGFWGAEDLGKKYNELLELISEKRG